MSSRTYDVAVIGAGVFGSWTAHQLQRSGKSVVLIDAYGVANERSSSGDESRIMRLGYGADEVYTRSAQQSLKLWKEFCAETNEPLFHQTGVLWIAHADDPYPHQTLKTIPRFEIPFETLTVPELNRRYPQLGTDRVSWALLEPESGILLARRAVRAIVREAIRGGVDYLQDAVSGTDVTSLKRAQDARATTLDRITTASGASISAAAYIFACGPWLPKIFPDLLADRIHPTRQEVFYFRPPANDRSFAPPALPAWIDFKDEMYGLPDIESLGVKIAIDRHGPAFDPDSGDRIVSEAGLAEVRECLARRLPALADAPLLKSRVCQYENTSNGDFLIDRHPEFKNVWLVGGGSGHGFKHGPAVGEYVAARIELKAEGVEPRFSLDSKKTTRERAVY